MFPKLSGLLSKVSPWSIALLFLLGTLFRWSFANDVSVMLDCDSCLLKQSMVHEIQFLLIALALHQFSSWLNWRWLGTAVRLLLLTCLLIMLIDVAVLRLFGVRFNWQELLKFSGELVAVKAFTLQFFNDPIGALVAIFLTLCLMALSLVYVVRSTASSTSKRSVYPWTLPMAMALLMQPMQERNFHTPYLENSVSAFTRPQTRLTAYGKDPLMNAKEPMPQQCSQGMGKSPNLILLVVESLSSFHSQALGKMHNWTPQLDHWLQRGLSAKNFHANGITTEDGLVALLTGLAPIPRPQAGNMFTQYAQVPNSIPQHLGKAGYSTAFLTTGNLSFMGKQAWLRGIGFQEIEGHEHPFYDGMPRFHFDAATDEALYARAIQWMGGRSASPYFLTLETVSTHQPFKHPVTGEKSLESVVRYADVAMGEFISKLSSSGFFENGYLIVTGDHRSMVPTSAKEANYFGDRAYAKIPLLILGPGLSGQQTVGNFSQTDVFPTLMHLTDKGPSCAAKGQGNIWPGASREPDCLLTRRPYDLDLVVAQCGDQNHPIKLNGNQTAYIAPATGPSHWIDQIHGFRLGLGWLSASR
ncbi:LTA synthase family protein [Limnohabitans sp.]|uniref:LTA synthase family protein n=1 Tax=Limnohabitans sp. TaxID=1907725 RepID=UPI002AFE6C91|nr:LTA synthase family protein [Limnohabitans sp.]